MTINNDFNFHDLDELLLCPDLFPIEPPYMNPATSEMATFSLRMEKMTIEAHTLKLRQLIERTKWHRVESTMKKVKKDVVSHKQLLHHLQQGDAVRQKQLNDMRQHYEDKLIRVSTTAYRGLARVHPLLITFTPYPHDRGSPRRGIAPQLRTIPNRWPIKKPEWINGGSRKLCFIKYTLKIILSFILLYF